jgi:hypothetical protein
MVVAGGALLSGCGGSEASTGHGGAARPGGYPQPGHLVPLLTLENTRLAETAALLDATGNDQEKRAGAERVVALAELVATDAWREAQRPVVAEVYRQAASGAKATDVLPHETVERRLEAWQQRHLIRVYDALKALDAEPVLAHCRKIADDDTRSLRHRQLARAVLAAHAGARSPTAGTGTAAPPVTPPRADAPRVYGGTIVDVDRVVDALRPYFRTCYLQALGQYGRFGSWIILNARVVQDGGVAGVTSTGDESAPRSMIVCLQAVLGQARFTPPVGGEATVAVPLSFTAAP